MNEKQEIRAKAMEIAVNYIGNTNSAAASGNRAVELITTAETILQYITEGTIPSGSKS